MDEKFRILAIDDNEINLQVMREALDDDFQVELAYNGLEGLALARATQPDVILLDVMMPGLDGYEVCRRIRDNGNLRSSRIIMVSAKTSLEDRLMGYDVGADDYVTKPFNEEELRTKIEFAIRARRLEQLCGATGELLALVAWLRDSQTVRDLHRTRECVQLLAQELRKGPYDQYIDDRFLDDLHHASVLRDVGQLSVPPAVRYKRTDLSPDEIEQMKQHTLVGSRLMNRLAGQHPEVGLFHMASEVARSHHEHFDGSGYPDRLRGEAIPLAARMLATIDVFETAADDRQIQPELGPGHIQAELGSGQGSRFDPIIATACLNMFDELQEVASNSQPTNAV